MKNSSKILALTLGVVSILSLNISAIETKAEYAYLIDADTGTELYNKNAYVKMVPSSMSKLMTVYIVLEKLKNGALSLDTKFIVSKNAWSKQGSKMFVKLGERVSVEDLIRGIIIQSGNDACIVIAEAIAGSEDEFAKLMNKKAKQLGLNDSNFVNSTGWPDEGHLMSARDIAILSKKIIENFPEYYHYFSEKEFSYNKIRQINRNWLLFRDINVDGLKTGHTDIAKNGVAASAKQDNRRLIVVVNGLVTEKERADEAERLLQYGFLTFANKKIAGKGEIVATSKAWLGKEANINLVANKDVYITYPKEFSNKVEVNVKYPSLINAPIKKGQRIGEIEIKIPLISEENFSLSTIDLVAEKDIEKKPIISAFFAKVIGFIFRD